MPPRFDTPLIVENLPTDERCNARLVSPLIYLARDGRRFDVPAGFCTDLASIPQLAQALIGKWERHAPAAVLHDWLYVTQPMPRRDADWLFAEALFAAGVPTWKRAAMWLAVRAGGGRAWRRNRQAIGDPVMPIFTREALERFAPRPRDPRKAAVWEGYVGALVEHGDALCAEFGIDEPLEVQHLMARAKAENNFEILWESGAYTADGILNTFGIGRHSAKVTAAEAHRIADLPVEERTKVLFERVYGVTGNPGKARELGNREPGDGWRYRGFGLLQTTGREDHEKYLAGETTYYAAVRAAFVEWDKKGCNEMARRDDVKAVCKAINGGYNGLEHQRAALAQAKRVWRVLPGSSAPPPPKTMFESTTARAAEFIGAGGSINTATEVSTAMAKIASSGRAFSIDEFVWALVQSPGFWIGVSAILGAAYIWLERRSKLIRFGI